MMTESTPATQSRSMLSTPILGEPLLADEHPQRTLVGLVPLARNGLLGL
jgi:hypothetical protein